MNTTLLILSLSLSSFVFGQEIIFPKPAIFTVNPQRLLPKNTNGINVGVLDDYQNQRINGINLQANSFGLLYLLLPKALPIPTKETSTVKINGLHISTGGMVDGEKLNGIGISMYHHARITNGISANFYNNTSGTLNGIHISGFANNSDKGNGIHISGFANNSDKGNGLNVAVMGNYSKKFTGLQVSFFNDSEKMRGMQIGLVNKSKNLKGLQIGLVNKSKKMKGLQIGFWNKNEKRQLPFINF